MNFLRPPRSHLVLLTLLFFPMLALAQAAPVAVDAMTPEGVSKLLLDAVMNKQWGIVVSLLITLLVAGVRKAAPENSKLGAWMKSKLGAIVMNFATALSGGFLTFFLAGQPFSLQMVVQALTLSVTAAGGWSLWKNMTEAVEERRAQAAGTSAAASPTDTLNK